MQARALWLLTLAASACDGAARPAPVTPAPVTPPPPTTPAPTPPASPPMQQPTLSAAVTDIVGPATADVLLRGSERATFVLDAKQFTANSTDPTRFAGYTILRRGRPLTDAEHQPLVKMLLADASYNPVDKYACLTDEAYGLRVTHGAEVVELMFVFPCNRVNILRRASADTLRLPGEYIDPVAPQLLEILRAATRP